jgi:hypothetical protein
MLGTGSIKSSDRHSHRQEKGFLYDGVFTARELERQECNHSGGDQAATIVLDCIAARKSLLTLLLAVRGELTVRRDVTLSTKAVLPKAADACVNATGVSTGPSTIVGNPNITASVRSATQHQARRLISGKRAIVFSI